MKIREAFRRAFRVCLGRPGAAAKFWIVEACLMLACLAPALFLTNEQTLLRALLIAWTEALLLVALLVVARTIASLLLVALLVIARTIATLLLVALLVIARTIATLLAGLIAVIIIIIGTRAIGTLWLIALKRCPKALGTESLLVVVAATAEGCTVEIVVYLSCVGVDARTR